MRLHGEDLDVTTIRDLVIARADLGDKPFVHLRDETLTYREAHLRSNRFANALAGFGIGKGDVVTTYLYNSVDHICVWFACAKLGAIWAPLNVSLKSDDLRYSIDDTRASVLIVDEELLANYLRIREGLAHVKGAVLWGESGGAEAGGMLPFNILRAGNERTPETPVGPTDASAITYTGGTTGMPKGVLLPHLYYIATALRYRELARVGPDDVHFDCLQLFHIGGQQEAVIAPMYCGITSVMTKWFSASQFWPMAKRYGATIIGPPGPMVAAIVQQPERADDRDHRVRVGIGVGSAQIKRELRDRFEERFGVPLLEVYAQTETGILLCSERLDDRRPGSCGRANGWAEFRIVDEDEQALPPGKSGQILLRPLEPHCFMLEYFNKPADTIAAWRNLWFHSGDLGYLDEDGYLYFIGRQAHWIRRRAENISAFEVEKIILAHPAVADCGVVGVPSELGEEDVKAFVQLKEGVDPITPLAIIQWCEERIAYFKVPRYVEFVADFPRSATKNDIERHALRDRGIGEAWDRERAGYTLRR